MNAWLGQRARIWRLARLAIFAAVGGSLVFAWPVRRNTPAELFHKALRAKDQKRWSQADVLFRRLVAQAPQAGLSQHAQYHLGILAYLQERWEPAIREFTRLITDYPDSRLLAESYYHIGLCEERLGHADRVQAAHEILEREFADTPWARYARERWSRSSGR
jgi:TolA-binding protein